MRCGTVAAAWVVVIVLMATVPFSSLEAEDVLVHSKPIRLRHLAGTVVDPKGMPIDYAKIELLNGSDHRMIASTFADGKGNFSFDDRGRGQELGIRA